MEKSFTEIYKTNHWGHDGNNEYNGSSGPGSEIHNNIPYIIFLENFITEQNIQSVVDLGCGSCKCLEKYMTIWMLNILDTTAIKIS